MGLYGHTQTHHPIPCTHAISAIIANPVTLDQNDNNMNDALVTMEVNDRVAHIQMNREDKRNALSPELVTELKEKFAAANEDEAVKVIVLKGGKKAFSAGADLAYLQELQGFSFEQNRQDSNHLMELFHLIYTMKKVVIAQVEGPAIAGGCGLATVCDLIFSTPDAKFGYSEVRIGFVPAIVMIFLLRKIGEGKVKELMLSGSRIDGLRAQEMGLVNFVKEDQEIAAAVENYAQKLVTQCSGDAMGLTKELIGQIQHMPVRDALSYAAEVNARARATEDCKQGVAAFLNKEAIKW